MKTTPNKSDAANLLRASLAMLPCLHLFHSPRMPRAALRSRRSSTVRPLAINAPSKRIKCLCHLLQLVSICFWLCSKVNSTAEGPKLVMVATYSNNTPTTTQVGQRAAAILRAQGIQSFHAGSRGIGVSVPAADATKAHRLLARAVKEERLPLTLVMPDAGRRHREVTPESILQDE